MHILDGNRSASESPDSWPVGLAHTVVMVALAAMAVVVLMAVLADDADAWSGTSIYGSEGNYKSGMAHYYYYRSSAGWIIEYYQTYDYTNPLNEYYYYNYGGGEYFREYYQGYFGVDIRGLDDRTYINQAYLYFYVGTEYNFDEYVALYQLHCDASTVDSRTLFSSFSSSVSDYCGSTYVYTTGYYGLEITGNALTYLRNAVKGDTDYIYYGLGGASASSDYFYIDPSSSYLYLYYDASAPNAPALNSMSTYTQGTSAYLSWSTPSDNPTAPNVGLAAYAFEVGVFESAQSDEPVQHIAYYSSGATGTWIGDLMDGKTYWFRMKARDASGFTSSWSSAVSTKMDASPPSVPIMRSEPLYTSGTGNVIEWAASTDAGIGTYYYQVQRSTSADFASATTDIIFSTSASYSDLVSEQRYYYRVRAVDYYGYASEWSVAQYSTQDDTAPSVPALMTEPPFTTGNMNTFEWHPSTDAGVGVAGYRVQVSTSSRFEAGTLVADTSVTGTWLSVGPLADGTTYFCRAASYDSFGHVSAWSFFSYSTQDRSGPSVPRLVALPEFSPDAPLVLAWDGASDVGCGVGWYTVEWATDEGFTLNYHWMDHVLGGSTAVTGLTPGVMWYFRVRALDVLGNSGLPETVSTTIDGTPPSAPVIDAEPAFTGGLENAISWSASTDDLAGISHYIVMVYGRGDGTGLVFTDQTGYLTMTVPGLADGATYWYRVFAMDNAGNTNWSALASSTQDASPPTVPRMEAMPSYSLGTALSVGWFQSSDRGAGGIEYQVEHALNPLFTEGVVVSGWFPQTEYVVGDLSDGATYYLRVRARDALGLESMPSDVVMTTMDDSPPPVPELEVPESFVPGPSVHLAWSRVTDGSGLPVEYVVVALDSAQAGATIIGTSPWLSGTSFEYTGLPTDTEVFFRVSARDALGHQSERSGAVESMIDTKGPAAATITAVPAYTKGTTVKLAWTAAVDAGVHQVEHRVIAFSDQALETRAFTSDWTAGTTADVTGLSDGQRYWFVVDCRDGFGNVGARSEVASTTMDASPPSVAVDAPGYFGPADGAVSGTCADAGAGVSAVEASSDAGATWAQADLSGGTWSVGLDALGANATEVWVRARDAVGNVLATYARAVVDTKAPTIAVAMPMAGATVSGAVMMLGSVSDPHLAGYIVEARRVGDSAWSTVQPYQATTGVAGTLATWVTAGLAGGEYTLRVTATDAVGLSTQFELAVTLKGARLTIGAGDISFSDSHPLPGDTVTVLVTVRNDGDSPADDMVVVLYDGSKEVGRATTSVQAHSVSVVPIKVKVGAGAHEFKARATSSLYDTGDMPVAQPLTTIEEEAALENAGGILGLVALILAVLCLLLILLNMRKGRATPAQAGPPKEDILEPMQ